ncbi:cytosine/adenosine deaminase-related metal-dependent hydrolase [Deinococcus metalli]|uniref:8-oxoguanine deaminase n=1 Tax=Deinococcus metalli TaxID=1141878 RepID=A0A7W8NS01_9DEIO|nr:8-oxoguanine deaminase [Deinococcus metalli]MBB5377448.1 cytosine/adenosine deaminase-related metal-dependent hydrolase [Deinococcus metalli]GHF50482.1 8-oxoguanine deaminase [Deinococcus metalli]
MTFPGRTVLRSIHTLITMRGERTAPDAPLPDAAVVVEDGVIVWVGRDADVPPALLDGAAVRDLSGHVVLPGLVNTHHHLYQTLTRCVAPDSGLFEWLRTLYPIWLRLTPDAAFDSAQLGLAELALSGCTTSSDHLYLYPNGVRLDDTIHAARDLGMRFHATRGSMSLGESQGGLPPDRAVERADAILADSARVIDAFHDPARYALTRIALAPCSPFSVTGDVMRESAALARAVSAHGKGGVMLHTHLAETADEDAFCLSMFGMRPLDYAESVGWVGPDVWFAHGVHFSPADAARLGQCGCGVAHCPSSNMRLASGIAPTRTLLEAGVKVALGVDGSASNDGSHLLAEARQALLSSRVRGVPGQAPHAHDLLTAHDALWLATRGGAAVLNRDDVGQLTPGYAADLIAVDLRDLGYSGARHDPLSALTLCAPPRVALTMVGGRVIVDGGVLTGIDLPALIERHDRHSRRMLEG